MVQSCSAYGCKNRYHKDRNISFHKFPLARPDVCGKWIAAMRRTNFTPTKYSNICSQHFTSDCFKTECNNRVLKESAVPSLFSRRTALSIKSESLEDPFPSEMDFALALPLSDQEEEPVLLLQQQQQQLSEEEEEPVLLLQQQQQQLSEEEEPVPEPDSTQTLGSSAVAMATITTGDVQACGPPVVRSQCRALVSCDHTYTVEDSVRQKKRISQLEEQLEHLRKRLKTTQQKCRRQERQLRRLRAVTGTQPQGGTSEGYVILPKEIYHVLKGINSIE